MVGLLHEVLHLLLACLSLLSRATWRHRTLSKEAQVSKRGGKLFTYIHAHIGSAALLVIGSSPQGRQVLKFDHSKIAPNHRTTFDTNASTSASSTNLRFPDATFLGRTFRAKSLRVVSEIHAPSSNAHIQLRHQFPFSHRGRYRCHLRHS
jgi:hypothetical protein